MRYEPVLVSDDEEREELTDLSASEDELLYSDLPHGSQVAPSVHVHSFFHTMILVECCTYVHAILYSRHLWPHPL